MQYARLGNAGVKVSRICLGTNMMGSYVDQESCSKLVHTFLEEGGNFIDTADSYSDGTSEEFIGRALEGRRQEAVLATKLYPPTGTGPNDQGSSRKHILDAVEGSLRRLNTDYIDLYILHFWDEETPIDETLRTMDALVRDGKVRYVGVSNFAAWHVVKSLWAADRLGLSPICSVQVEYSLGRRGAEAELFPLALAEGLAVTSFFVLRAGMFTGKYQRGQEPPADSRFGQLPSFGQSRMNDETFGLAEGLEEVAKQVGHTPTETALAWALSKPAMTSVIVGSSKPEQITANCAAVDIELSPEHLEALDGLGPGVPTLTHRMSRMGRR